MHVPQRTHAVSTLSQRSQGRAKCLSGEKIAGGNACLLDDGSQCPFRHVSRMVRNGGEPAGFWIAPNFVAARGLAIELKTVRLQALHDLAIAKSAETAHQALTIIG